MSSSLRLRLSCALVISFLAAAFSVPLQAATDPTYTALRGAKPDGRKIPVQNLVLERDAFRFQLDSGTLHLLAPVDGHTIGAVFVGQGSYRLSPATANESRQLALSSGTDKGFEALTDTFENLFLLFTDGTLAELEHPLLVLPKAPPLRPATGAGGDQPLGTTVMTPIIGVPKLPSGSWIPPSGPGAAGWLCSSRWEWNRQ